MAHKYYLLDKKNISKRAQQKAADLTLFALGSGLDSTAPSGQDIIIVYSSTSTDRGSWYKFNGVSNRKSLT